MKCSEAEFLASYPQKAQPSAGTGHPGNLVPDQQKALDHLTELVRAQGYADRTDEATLLRFLRARKFDVMKAHEMYTANEKWRKEYGTNTILQDFEYPERNDVLKYYPKYYYQTDIDGRPVYYEEIGKVDITKLLKITTKERMLRDIVYEYEAFTTYRLPAASRKVGHLVETSCTVLDLKGISLSLARSVYGFISDAAYIGQNYYPERMGKFYIINAPWGFSMVWSVIKKFLDPVTVDKIHILGSKYQSELARQVPPENLPVEFGGKAKADGPIYLSDDGPWRESKYQGPEVDPNFLKEDGDEKPSVPAAASVPAAVQTKAEDTPAAGNTPQLVAESVEVTTTAEGELEDITTQQVYKDAPVAPANL